MYNKILKPFRNHFNSLCFSKKLQFSFLLVVAIPVIMLGTFSFALSTSYVKRNNTIVLENQIELYKRYINSELDKHKSVVKNFCYNNLLLELLATDNINNVEQIEDLNTIIMPLSYNLLLGSRGFKRIEVYTPKNIVIGFAVFKQYSDIGDKYWYESTIVDDDFHFYIEDNYIIMTKRIYDIVNRKILGVTKVTIMKSSYSLAESGIVEFPIAAVLYNNTGETEYGIVGSKELYSEETLENGFALRMYVDQAYFQQGGGALFVLLNIIICCGLLFWVIHGISKLLIKRIVRLTNTMKNVESNEFNVELAVESNDEIGELYEGFNFLVNKIFAGAIREKELKIELLNAKINPHFLYNTLSAINWIAIRKKETQISRIIVLLSQFYRSSLHNGDNIVTINDELKNIKSYLDLEMEIKVLNFQYDIQVDKKILEHKIPNFALQPLVENAIVHGIKKHSGSDGKIIVLGEIIRIDNLPYISIKVFNNGGDIDVDNIGNKEDRLTGYGLKNIESRIKLFFGDKSKLILSHDKLSGFTCAQLILDSFSTENKKQ